MTILILLVLVVLLWVAVLAPSAWRRFNERQGVGSIDSFHHELQLLEHAGPKTVAPAYRLHTARPGAAVAESVAREPDVSRPKLVLLRPTEDAGAADVEDEEGTHYERVGVLDRPEPACIPDVVSDLPAFRREEARRRCTVLLRCLCGVAVSTGLIGFFPKFHILWVLTGLTGIAALVVVGLIAYAKEIEAERQRRQSRRVARREPEWVPASSSQAAEPAAWADQASAGWADQASAGYPGAWDDEDDYDEMPRAAAR